MSGVTGSVVRLGVDARDAFAGQARGVGKTLRALLAHLTPLLSRWSVLLYTNRLDGFTPNGPVRTRLIDVRGDRWNAWENVRLPVAALMDRLDLLHCPAQTAPPITPCPIVLTVHDLIPARIGDGWSRHDIDRFRRALSRSVRSARRIIAVSEFTRGELLTDFPDAAAKTDVVYWGADHVRLPGPAAEDDASLHRSHGIRGPFFLAFGGPAPRKNVVRILEAFAEFRRQCRDGAQLVLVGTPPAAAVAYSQACDALGLTGHVAILPYLDDSQVTLLLARAEALVYPSLYEGFGLPVLEAMALGTPVITSSTTCLPEVAGDAAILVDPTSVGAISEAIAACYQDTSLKSRLAERGRRRAASFTWERAARATLDTYRLALEAA